MKRITLLIICMLFIAGIAIAANNTAGNPLYFDTAAGAKTGRINIQSITWEGIAGAEIAADNDLKITDTAGRVIAIKRAKASTDGLVLNFPFGLVVNGVIVTSIDSGICIIYATD